MSVHHARPSWARLQATTRSDAAPTAARSAGIRGSVAHVAIEPTKVRADRSVMSISIARDQIARTKGFIAGSKTRVAELEAERGKLVARSSTMARDALKNGLFNYDTALTETRQSVAKTEVQLATSEKNLQSWQTKGDWATWK